MSELFMECVEEELEPWQKQVPQVHLIDDDDDEPIFVGVLSNSQKDGKNQPAPPQKNSPRKQDIKRPPPQASAAGPAPVVLPLSAPATTVNAAPPNLTTVTPQPVIVNNQGFIVTSPQMTNHNELIATLGSRYPPGTSFTIVPAGQQQLFQQVSPATALPGVVHRPQVQQIRNNVVTLSHVQSPAVYSIQSSQLQAKRSNLQLLQTISAPVKENSNNRDPISVKKESKSLEGESVAKKAKLDLAPAKVTVKLENGILKKKCPKCQEELLTEEAQKYHTMRCRGNVGNPTPSGPNSSTNKLIMLVADFYYGRFEGEQQKKEAPKTNTTFKCQSCLKVLKNNIRFMNHMKHHLELEKQNSESWESHTTCQHCYRQYMTPFQLQCHIESAHSPIESSTNCKICELAFESEQVLLEHMKGNHKPGEMPYVCQVCSYRSSFFSDVETHFRSVHENTKDLLCPFCLKVLRTSHIYMQHYMKHQKKGIHRCGKCRLNFLTYKEKVEHRTHVHKTFRKPRALEGLPPGTKVTIRASLVGKSSVSPLSPDRSAITVRPEPPTGSSFKVGVSKSKPNNSGAGKAKAAQNKKRYHPPTKHNLALKNLSINGGRYTCIECNGKVADFFSHYPMVSSCGACNYRTSCKTSIGNHMIKFHSTISKQKFLKMDQKKHPPPLRYTILCLDCNLLVDASGGDLMTKHLTDKPNHLCRVIQEREIKTEDQEVEIGNGISKRRKLRSIALAALARHRHLCEQPCRYCALNRHSEVLALYFDEQSDLRPDFRLSRPTVAHLIQVIGSPSSKGWGHDLEVLVFLFWLSSATSYGVVSRAFGIPRATVTDIVHRVANKVMQLKKSMICLPSQNGLKEAAAGFESLAGSAAFSRVVGSIDGCHVKIKLPVDDARFYLNKESFHSIQIQGVCDHQCQFLDIFAGFPGSVRDAKVLQNSSLYEQRLYPPTGYCILGDGGYPCMEQPIAVVTPYREPVTSAAAAKFNMHHAKAHSVISRAFGSMKTRWQSIFFKVLEVHPVFAVQVIACCAILHNFCLRDGDTFEPEVESLRPDYCDDHLGPDLKCGEELRERMAAALSAPDDTPRALQDHDYY
ncbi:zinc finger protein 280C isoform X1 [Odontesthes bonariensis]|uniref:zinc finger protein 280C isoform X1 n=1 Tax=Odontesthes bonariensis TaxID=219752 RepID=UPI003F587E17